MRTYFFVSILFLCSAVSVISQQKQPPASAPSTGTLIPENDEARSRLRDLFYAPSGSLIAVEEKILRQQSTGSLVKFEVRRQSGKIYYLFLNERGSEFPVAGLGNYIIKRNPENGRFDQIKVFTADHPDCFIRLFPSGTRTSMDVYLYGLAVDRGVLLPADLQSFLTEPFTKIKKLSGATVHWDQLLYRRSNPVDRTVESHLDIIRRALPLLSDRDDGAMDADRKFVNIDNGLPQEQPGGLNCSGFAKWVADGFYHPLRGRYLDIEPLKDKHLEYRGNRWSFRFEEERDPYFGLDWSRNLAQQLWQARGYPSSGPETFDVRKVFYLHYREDVGFPVEELAPLLFLETSANPGHFYLGSLNREYGGQPVLRQHFHLLVLFPYFTVDGSFEVAIFERNRESSLEEIGERFRGTFIHLVRLPLGDVFLPPLPQKTFPRRYPEID